MNYSIDVIRMGRSSVPTVEINWMDLANLEKWESININVVAIRNDEVTALINTGPPRNSDDLNHFWQSVHPNHELFISDEEQPEAVLDRIGIKPEKVDYIFITPLTAYTTGNLDLFPNAKIFISRRGWKDYLVPEPYAHRLPDYMYVPTELRHYLLDEAKDRIILLSDEEQEVIPGIKSFFTGSHHRSSMAYVIDTSKGKVVVSDCFFKYRNIEENIPLGINESMEETLLSYEKIRNQADIILPLYDPEVYERHPNGVVVGD